LLDGLDLRREARAKGHYRGKGVKVRLQGTYPDHWSYCPNGNDSGVRPHERSPNLATRPACPPTLQELPQQIHQRLDEIIASACKTRAPRPSSTRETLLGLLQSLGCLFDSALSSRPATPGIDLTTWTQIARLSRLGRGRTADAQDQLRGGHLQRAYLVPRRSVAGVHPLDVLLGLTRDAYQPAGHRLVLPAGRPGSASDRPWARRDVPRFRARPRRSSSGSWAWLGPLMST